MAAFTTLQQSSLVQLYVGILGTTPTTAALNTYATIFVSTSGTDAQKYDAVAAAMVASTAGQTKYPVFATAGQIANTMFGHLGLPGSAEGADGTKLEALAIGILNSPGVTVASFARTLLNALNTFTFSGTDALSVAAAKAKTAYGVDATGVAGTTLKAAVDTALGVTTPVTDPVSKSFTTAADQLEGGAGNDTFSGSVLASSSPVSSGDKVDGKGGDDTVDIRFISDGTNDLTLELVSVEKAKFQLFETMTASGALWDSSVKEVTVSGLADMDAVFTGLPKATNFVVEAPNSSNKDLTATFIDLTGSADSVAVSLKGASGSTVTLNQTANAGVLESVMVTIDQSASGAPTTIIGSAFSATTALTVTGDGEKGTLTLNGNSAVGNVTLVDVGSGSIVNIVSSGNNNSANQTLNFASASAVAFTANVGNGGDKILTGGAGNDTVTFNGTGSGNVVASLAGGNDVFTVNATLVGTVNVDGGEGNDTITIYGSGGSGGGHTVVGGDGNDTITATNAGSANLVISAGSGADTISIGVAGAHSILGGDGADTITATTFIGADDTIRGGDGSDVLTFTLSGPSSVRPTTESVETITVVTGAVGRRLDMSAMDGVTRVNVGGSASQIVATNVSGVSTLNFGDGRASGTNSISFKAGANANLTVTGTGATTGSSLTLSNVATVTLSGNSAAAGGGWSGMTINTDTATTTSITINGVGSGDNSIVLGTHSALTALNVSHNGSGSTTITDSASIDETNLTTLTISTGNSGNVTLLAATGINGASALGSLTITAGDQSVINIGSVSGNSVYFAPNLTVSVGSASQVTLEEFDFTPVSNDYLNGSISITSNGSGLSSLKIGSAIGGIGGWYQTTTVTKDTAFVMNYSCGNANGLDRMSAAITISTGSGNDVLIGGHGADTLSGGAGSDTIISGSGADVIIGGNGSDTFVLGGGTQTIVYRGSSTGDVGASGTTVSRLDQVSGFVAGAGGDIIDFWGGSINTLSVGSSAITANITSAATTSLFGVTAGYEIHLFRAGSAIVDPAFDNRVAAGTSATAAGGLTWGTGSTTGIVDFKTTSAFSMLFGGSANNTQSLFSGASISIDGSSGYGLGFSGASAAAALVLYETNYGSANSWGGVIGTGGGTYAIFLEYSGSGSTQLSTANVVGQLFLAGVTASLVIGNFG